MPEHGKGCTCQMCVAARQQASFFDHSLGDTFYDPDARPVETIKVPERDGLPYLQQPSKWTCLPTSFAMVLGTHGTAARLLQDMMEQLGRDDERGYHTQEFLGIAVTLRVAFVQFEFKPEVDPAPCLAVCVHGKIPTYDGDGYPIDVECKACHGRGNQGQPPMILWPLKQIMAKQDGVLLGKRKGATHFHAVAWCSKSQLCLDPEQGIYGLTGFEPIMFLAAFKLA